jgi:RNA polymerase sigma-70 factor (ECF subfamily)
MSNPDADALDQADMARLQAGHDGALNDLMTRHAGVLHGFLSRFIGDEDSADDLAQETFVRVYLNRSTFKTGTRFSPWLFTIAGNLARNHLRTRSRRPEVPLDAPGPGGGSGIAAYVPGSDPTPDEGMLRAERNSEIRRAVAALPDDLREAVVLCELEDRAVAEAAGLLSTTVKAVESRLYRARKQLRDQLSRWMA